MEANTQNKSLMWDKGICNKVADAICNDSELADCLNLTYEAGSLVPIQEPKALFPLPDNVVKLLGIHRTENYTHYIALLKTRDTLTQKEYHNIVWFSELSPSPTSFMYYTTENPTVQTIGNTIIINQGGTLNYFLWQPNKGIEGGEYLYLGNAIPEVDVEFTLKDASIKPSNHDTITDNVPWVASAFRGLFDQENILNGIRVKNENYSAFMDGVFGCYAQNKKAIANKKLFAHPFFIRTAIELYDGSYYHIGNPVLLMPSVTNSTWFEYFIGGSDVSCKTHACSLHYYVKEGISKEEWGDICKKIVVFISDDIELFDLSQATYVTTGGTGAIYFENADNNCYNAISKELYISSKTWGDSAIYHSYKPASGSLLGKRFEPLTHRAYSDIESNIKNPGAYYKLCDIEMEETSDFKPMADRFPSYVLENITTQQHLEVDDFYSHCVLKAEASIVYNRRLHLTNVKRGFFDGFKHFNVHEDGVQKTYHIYVYIKGPSGFRVVKKEIDTTEIIDGTWFFYPDTRAYKAQIFILDSGVYKLVKELALEEHPSLNGAYYFGGMPTDDNGVDNPTTATEPTDELDNTPEPLGSYVLQSDVDNPFTFNASGYTRIGSGKVLGLASTTTALSEGQFGSYPLLAFTTEGIWALSVGNDGTYQTVVPMSREVCSNPESITMTDGAIFFVSKKGLMMVVGSKVTCVSEQLSGKVVSSSYSGSTSYDTSFNVFIQSCHIAYDYRDSQLWLIRDDCPYYWIYNIKSNTFSRKEGRKYSSIVNYYPDTLMQGEDNHIYSLLDKDNINNDLNKYNGSFVTRPMKMENAIRFKSVRDLIHFFDSDGQLSLTILASNDLKHWHEVPFLGRGWKFLVFKFSLFNLSATDAYSGAIANIQTSETNKLR